MANAITAFNPEYWAQEMQVIFFKESVAIALAHTQIKELLNDGDTINKPFRSKPRVVTYTKGTDITIKDRTSTNEQLIVDTAKVVPFYVDDIDKIQNKWDAAQEFAQDGMRQLNIKIDQFVTVEVAQADSTVDAGDVGGSSGSAISLSVSNIDQIFTAGNRKLDVKNVPTTNRFALIGSRTLEKLRLYLAGKETAFGDMVGDNGRVMTRFGFEIFFSNNVYFTASLGLATNVTESDTVVIAGVTFTFNATPSGAGSVDIGGSAALTVDNLVAAVNDSGTAGTTYIQLSDDDRYILEDAGIVATDGTTAMTIIGFGDIVLSETLTDATDVWASEIEHSMFGRKGATDLVVQKSPNVEFRLAEKRLGRYVYPWSLYGKKTYDIGDAQLVDVNIDASGWT